jgi:hypothetical protein
VPSSRLRALVACLAVSGVLLTGCGHGADKKPPATAAASPSRAPSSAPPSYAAERVTSSMLAARDIAGSVGPQPPRFPGLERDAAPSCADAGIKLPGDPKITKHQFGNNRSPFKGGHYIALAAVYGDFAGADSAMSAVQSKVAACPRKRHFPAKKASGKIIALQHDDTWQTTEDALSGWRHVRGFLRHVEPPSSSVNNVFLASYDYVSRGNVILATVYWERVAPAASQDKLKKRATALLTKQLHKFG